MYDLTWLYVYLCGCDIGSWEVVSSIYVWRKSTICVPGVVAVFWTSLMILGSARLLGTPRGVLGFTPINGVVICRLRFSPGECSLRGSEKCTLAGEHVNTGRT